jgi:hypothetical protein
MSTQLRAQIYCAIIIFGTLSMPHFAWPQDTTGACDPGESSSLTPEASDNVDTADQAAGLANPFHLTKQPLYKISADILLQTGVKKTFTTSANFDPTLPTATNDVNQALSLYLAVTTPTAAGISNGVSAANKAAKTTAKAISGTGIGGGPIQATLPPPTDNASYVKYVQANCQGMTNNGKRAFIGMFMGTDLGDLYGGSRDGSLDQTFNAIQGNGKPGQCGPIAQFMSETMTACGLPDSGVMSAIGHVNGQPDEGHYVAYYKDPTTGHYIVFNYGQGFDTNETRLTDAVEVANAQLGDSSRMSVVEQNGKMHMNHLISGAYIDGKLQLAEDLGPGHSHIEVNVGTIENSATVRASAQTAGGTKIGVFGTAVDTTEDHGLFFAAAGVTVQKDSTFAVSDKTQVNADIHASLGVMALHDTPPGVVLNALTGPNTVVEGFEDLDVGAQVTHKSTNGNQFTVGVSGHGDGDFGTYVRPPYDVIKITAEDSPSKTATIHVASVYNLTTPSPESTNLIFSHNYDSAGVAVQKQIKSVNVKNDATVYALGGVESPDGLGVRDQTEVSKNVGKTQVGVTNDLTLVKTGAQNTFWQQPTTDLVGVEATRDTKIGTFQLGVTYRANQEQPGEEFRDNTGDVTDPDTHPSKAGFSLTWTSKPQNQ